MSSGVNFLFITLTHLLISSFTNSHQLCLYMGGKTIKDYLVIIILFPFCCSIFIYLKWFWEADIYSCYTINRPGTLFPKGSTLPSDLCPSSENLSLTTVRYPSSSSNPCFYSVTLFLFLSQYIPAGTMYFVYYLYPPLEWNSL